MTIPEVSRMSLVLLVLPLLMLLSYILIPTTVHDINRKMDREKLTLTICVYNNSCISSTILGISNKLINVYGYCNVSFILFGNVSQLLHTSLIRRCDVVVGLSNLLTYVLLKKGVIRARFLGLGLWHTTIPYSLTLLYAAPYSYKVLEFNDNNTTAYIEKLVLSELLGKELKESISSNLSKYDGKTLLVYEVMVVQNNIPRKLLEELLNLANTTCECIPLSRLSYKGSPEDTVSQFEVLQALRKLAKSNTFIAVIKGLNNND